MKILGIHSITHDVSAAFAINGKIQLAVEEERLSRIKHHPGIQFEGTPPKKAIKWILEQSIQSIDKLDLIVHVGWPGGKEEPLDIMSRNFRDFAEELDPGLKKTIFVDHHMAHAAFSYYSSGFNDAIILIIDGHGDYIATSIYILREKDKILKKIEDYHVDQSLGMMYTRAAKVLGLGKRGFGEGKMMALAAYGKIIKNFPKIIEIENNKYRINDYKEIFEEYKRVEGEKITQKHKDFAATIQDLLEKTVVWILNENYKKYKIGNICLGGGVGLNCSLNGKIENLPWVKNLFIPPAANDSGLSIGAVYLGMIKKSVKPKQIKEPYIGPEIKNEEIEKLLKSSKINFEKLEEPYKRAAESISRGKIVGWMQDKVEFGPRALGNRSLLGNPKDIKIRDKLNEIKGREKWRPVAVSLINKDYIKKEQMAMKYMTIAKKLDKSLIKMIPAGVHIDGTSRVQVVQNKESSYYKLLEELEKKIGLPIVLNTSLNSRDEPLCTSSADGIKFFYTSAIDELYLNNYRISKD